MPVRWAFAPFVREPAGRFPRPARYCIVRDYEDQILADPEYAGGVPWSAFEVLGNQAIVKVRASNALLSTIAAAPGVQAIPARFTDPDTTLGDLTSAERTQLLNKLTSMGYTTAEISAALGSSLSAWRTKTLRQVFNFCRTRRFKPTYDEATDTINLNGDQYACEQISVTDEVL